jgi:hypothetical protein
VCTSGLKRVKVVVKAACDDGESAPHHIRAKCLSADLFEQRRSWRQQRRARRRSARTSLRRICLANCVLDGVALSLCECMCRLFGSLLTLGLISRLVNWSDGMHPRYSPVPCPTSRLVFTVRYYSIARHDRPDSLCKSLFPIVLNRDPLSSFAFNDQLLCASFGVHLHDSLSFCAYSK